MLKLLLGLDYLRNMLGSFYFDVVEVKINAK